MAKTVMTTPGNALNNEIQDYMLKVLRVPLSWRQNTKKIKINGHLYSFGYTGCADNVGMMPDGRMFQIEGKSKNDDPSPAQLDNLKTINDNGGIGILAYSLDDVINRLRAEGYKV
jgi:predicted component of type VI protein secretion system